MARLIVRMLGPLQITLDGVPATGFVSDKARALLAYLAAESSQPHRREKLAGPLWSEWPDSSARTNLRGALANLRQVIEDHEASPPFLQITRRDLQINPAGDVWVDVRAFSHRVEARGESQSALRPLEEAVELYRGDLLEGFTVADSPLFEEWALLNRERFRRLVVEALQRLADGYQQSGAYEQGLPYAWRQVELDPWRERAHRQLMRLLALSGQRGRALAQYVTCCSLLAKELGVEPAEETTRLYERIRDGALVGERESEEVQIALPAAPKAGPRFLEAGSPAPETPVFVARERELAQLEGFLGAALKGEGRVAFVTGEAGSGKTALVKAFSRRSQKAHPDLIVAGGNCHAYAGIGDPYLPFRHILALLTGDVESPLAAGAITREHARRLWDAVPFAARALMTHGPDLVGTFLPRAALLERAAQASRGARTEPEEWLAQLRAQTERQPGGISGRSAEQIALFEQLTRVLHALARRAPLMLILDDLHWADAGSISLLFHIGRQLAGSRTLVVGTYRGEEVAIGRDGQQHPLEPVVHECQRLFGDVTVNLARAAGERFVEDLLATEPNRLDSTFRQMLQRHTGGHPLFTIELLRGLQERGDLIQDPDGRWMEGPALDWDTLPARVEAVIAQRIRRLAEPLREALLVASVEGEVFTAEVVARVRGVDEKEAVERLSRDLDRRHRLVRAEGLLRLDGRCLSRYRFRHILFQTYLYGSLDEVERAHLHEAVGNGLETLYGEETEAAAEIAGQLARHFEEAGRPEKAITYLRRAGARALQLSAFQEAIALLTKGLSLLEALPRAQGDYERLARAKQELALHLDLGIAWVSRSAYGPEAEGHYTRARALSQQLGETSQLCVVLGRLSTIHHVRSEHGRARELAEEALSLAERSGDPLHTALGHVYLGAVLLCLGEFTAAKRHLEQMIAFYDPERHHDALVSLRGSDAGMLALAYHACCLWCLGYPDQALRESQEVLGLARGLGHPWSLAGVLCWAACMVSEMSRDAEQLKEAAEKLARLAQEKVPTWSVAALHYRAAALAMVGSADAAIAQLREGIAAYESTGFSYYASERLRDLAEAQAQAGQAEQGLTTLHKALAFVEETNERHWEAELRRLRGELLLAQGDEAEAEASFHQAIEVARRQSAKSWELRATISLARLWRGQGRSEAARRVLSPVYGWFTEGFDTADLVEARTLLAALAP